MAGRRLVMMAGLLILLLPLTCRQEKAAASNGGATGGNSTDIAAFAAPDAHGPIDPRAVRLQHFLAKLHCPIANMASDFIRAADDNQLDWRLLPSISIIESSGGKAYRNNNIFGWANGDLVFPTIRAGLNLVAFKLGQSRIYRHRDVPAKLHLYNPDETYATRVMDVMSRISPQD